MKLGKSLDCNQDVDPHNAAVTADPKYYFFWEYVKCDNRKLRPVRNEGAKDSEIEIQRDASGVPYAIT